MSAALLAALFALFLWWFSTGVVLYLDGLPRWTFRWSMLGATLVAIASLYGIAATSHDTSVPGCYLAFLFGLLVWGWQEISFYMGWVTGPRREACPDGCSGWRHFVHALETTVHHELAIIASALLVVGATWGAPNKIALWTFLALWGMHQSARLNVFLGVRNLNEEFLPDHLRYLESFLKRRPMNLLFPVSVTVGTAIAAMLVRQALAPGATPFEQTGSTILATLVVLAVVEHWVLVLPLPFARLWAWGLTSRERSRALEVDVAVGFLGGGEPAFLGPGPAQAGAGLRGVALLGGGMDVAALPGPGGEGVTSCSGWVCLPLRTDLKAQLEEVAARWAPRRVLIEPSGVAEVRRVLAALEGAAIRPLLRALRLHARIDARSFLADYARLRACLGDRTRLTPVCFVVNADLVSRSERRIVFEALRAFHPEAEIVDAGAGPAAEAPLGSPNGPARERAGHPDPAAPAVLNPGPA